MGRRADGQKVKDLMMRRVTTTIAMTLAWATATAQTLPEPEIADYPRYTVEVIIFEYAEDVSVGTERFLPEEPTLPATDENGEGELVFGDAGSVPASEAAPVTDTDIGVYGQDGESELADFVLHVEDDFTMTDVASRLERLDVYRPVMHFAWTQVTRPEEETQPIELGALAEPAPGLDGSFTLYLSRYLHLVVDLSLEQQPGLADPVAIDDTGSVYRDSRSDSGYEGLQPAPMRFHISEDRIFKSGDLRYFDHPKFGVLAKVTRVEEPEDEEAEPGLVGELGQ
jgi:hypothetical protein